MQRDWSVEVVEEAQIQVASLEKKKLLEKVMK